MKIKVLTEVSLAWFLAAFAASASVFTNLYTFSADAFSGVPNAPATNADGANPIAFVVSGGTIYGTTQFGGLNGDGAIFRMNTDGSHFTNLFNFNLGTYDSQRSIFLNSTGETPNPGLVLVSNTLYGTTFQGGKFDAGVVFKINTDGSDFSLITVFDYTNGAEPAFGLTLSSNAFYGATLNGTNTYGDFYKINLSDLGFSKLYQLESLIEPYGGVALSSNQIYGIARYSSDLPNGFVYRLGTGGFVDLFDFNGTNGAGSYSTPIIDGNTIYGVTYQGGTNGSGNIFCIDLEGHNYTNLFSFPGQGGANMVGAYPYDYSGLLLSGNKLYGTASVSGSGGQGALFQINTDGTGYTVLHSFQFTDGGQPDQLFLDGGSLYGITFGGGQGASYGDGVVFDLILQPTLTISENGNQAVLTWNDPSYSLFSAPTLTNTFTAVPGASNPYTNTISGAQRFFLLRPNEL